MHAIETVQNIMKFSKIKCWLMYTDEHSDPFFSKIISDKVIVPTIAIVTDSECSIIVNSLDAGNLKNIDKANIHVYIKHSEMWDAVKNILSVANFPDKIHLSYSTLHDAQVDVLGHGLYLHITEEISSFYKKNKNNVEFPSSENIIYAFYDRKDSSDIEKMKIAANRALEILESAFEKIRVGMTEKQVVSLVHRIMEEDRKNIEKLNVVKEEFSWNSEYCPVVLAGPSLQKGGHAMASDLVVQEGHTIYFDFGVCLTFSDGSKCSSDIQRMGYILKKDEIKAPENIEKMFHTIVSAIEKGMQNIRAGMKGYEIDNIVRNHIISAGYPDYDHATGHAIGELAHNPGTLIGPRSRSLANLDIQPNGVYTLEPRIPINNGGSVEEMVLVTDNGGISLCKAQKEIFLIKR